MEGESKTVLPPIATKTTTTTSQPVSVLSTSDKRIGGNGPHETNDAPKQSATAWCQSNNSNPVTEPITKSPATTETPKKSLPPKAVPETWESVNTSGRQNNRNRVAGYNDAGTVNNYSNARQQYQSYQSSHQKNQHSTMPSPLAARSTPTTTRTSPSSGSWAARLQKSQPVASTILESSRSLAMKTTITPNSSFASLPPPTPPSPSTDWRHHASPQIQRAVRSSRSLQTDSVQTNGLQSETKGVWPSLKEFPTAPGLGSKRPNIGQANGLTTNTTAASTQQKKPLQGAWGQR